MKIQRIATQVESPSAAVPPEALAVTVHAVIAPPAAAGLTLRRKLVGLFRDGSERVILTHVWPDDPPAVIVSETALRVWTKIDPSDVCSIGEEITTN